MKSYVLEAALVLVALAATVSQMFDINESIRYSENYPENVIASVFQRSNLLGRHEIASANGASQ